MIAIKSLCEHDLRALSCLQQKCFSLEWSDAQIMQQLQHKRALSLGVFDAELIGFVFIRTLLDEAELLQIAVAPTKQGKGFAQSLLDALITLLKEEGIARLMLEVRRSNRSALSLYRHYGFVEEGVRKEYYPSLGAGGQREDALLLSFYCSGK